MCTSLQSGTRLHFVPMLQETFMLKSAWCFNQHYIQVNHLYDVEKVTTSPFSPNRVATENYVLKVSKVNIDCFGCA